MTRLDSRYVGGLGLIGNVDGSSKHVLVTLVTTKPPLFGGICSGGLIGAGVPGNGLASNGENG